VPEERQLAVRFEDILARPQESMERICGFAGLELQEDMLHPYRDAPGKMTGGLHGISIMRGDPKFHQHSAIDPEVAERWKKDHCGDFLGDISWVVTEALGYPREDFAPESSAPSQAAVPVQPRGSRPPFFFVAGVQNHFGSRLGPDQPFYRLQIQKLGADEPLDRTEEMAAWCLEGMKAIQPEGPYYIGGHCFGGVVAFEMAQQLHARGEEVALLVLAESFAAATRGELIGSRCLRIWQRLLYQLHQARRAGLPGAIGHIARGLRRRMREWFWRTTHQYQDPRAANYKAQKCYSARKYAGSAVLFQCEERGQWRRGLPRDGWGELLEGGLEVHRVPGSHTGMYREPNVAALVEKLEALLRGTQEDSGA
jgi:thioesterase domain-containing protein